MILGIVPFFHSLGFTVTLWGPLLLDIRAAYHFSPLDAQQVGQACQSRRATILLATPTFLRELLAALRAGGLEVARDRGRRRRKAAERLVRRVRENSACGPSKATARPSSRRW